jgi:Ribbon-helix-helix protein, copG family
MPPPTSDPQSTRLTAHLLPKVSAELQSLCDRTGRSKTDLVNRALSLYEWAEGITSDGKELLIRDPGTGESTTIVFT